VNLVKWGISIAVMSRDVRSTLFVWLRAMHIVAAMFMCNPTQRQINSLEINQVNLCSTIGSQYHNN